jgi:hypothetical protein
MSLTVGRLKSKLYGSMPTPPFKKKTLAGSVYTHVWQHAISGDFSAGGTMGVGE